MTSAVIHRYFGHWLLDGLGLETLADERGLSSVAVPRLPWLHEAGYRILAERDAPSTPRLARVDRLWLTDDRGLNSDRIRRLRSVNAAVRASVTPTANNLVVIARGRQGAVRRLINEDEVLKALVSHGFTVLYPEEATANEIVATLANARIVVGVEGSAMSHTNVASPPGCTILNIQPPSRFNALGKKNADALGHRWGFTVADGVGKDVFYQPTSRLLKTIDLVDSIF